MGVNGWRSAVQQRMVLCDDRAVQYRTVEQNGDGMITKIFIERPGPPTQTNLGQ